MTHTAPRKTKGFTLAEVLISLGIFAVGMIAVASLFPVAAILQKETADDILGKQAATNARATLEAVGLTYFTEIGVNNDLDFYHTASDNRYGATTLQYSGVVPVEEIAALSGPSYTFYKRYSILERSFPTTEADFNERDHYWFFYVRDAAGDPAGPNWQGYVLIVERLDGQNYNTPSPTHPDSVFDQLDFGIPTQQDAPYITVDGKTGTWDLINPITPLGGGVFFHPQGVAVETFTFDTIAP
ncbi:MAG: prepilin-type N-terminal cleavage/methylation domain-containing protein [Planctomycetota bacterium]